MPEGVGDQRRALVGRPPERDRVVEARPAPPAKRVDELVQEHLEVAARARSSVARTWSSWTGVDVCWTGKVSPSSIWAPRASPVEVDEEVALEEDPRADLIVRVGVQRQPVAVDPHVDDRGLAAAGDVAHAGDLADVDAGDPHRRGRLDVVGVLNAAWIVKWWRNGIDLWKLK